MIKFLQALSLLAAGMCMYAYVRSVEEARASRNAAGTYSTPNTFVTGTTISSTNMNANFSDIATEMTDSLDRSGKGGMLAALRGIDGTQAAPAYSWTSETGTGLFRNASNDVRFSVGGTSKTFWGTLGFGIGLAPTTLLHVQGTVISASKGQGYFKGVSDHGYLTIDTDSPTTKEAGLVLDQNGTRLWEIYIPANSNDLRFYNGADRVIINSSGLTIGSSGTAISKSIRGTATWNPGTLGACGAGPCATASTTITVTGAVVGADCIAGVSDPAPLSGYPVQCIITADTCNLEIVNQANVSKAFGSATFWCRAFNP